LKDTVLASDINFKTLLLTLLHDVHAADWQSGAFG